MNINCQFFIKIFLICSIIIFLYQFIYIYDIDLIDNKTLTLHPNDPQKPEATCQSEPYKNYLPFALTLQTKDKEYNFYCAPTLHYQVFVLCVGWLLHSVFLGFFYYFFTQFLQSKYSLQKLHQKIILFAFLSIVLLVFSFNEITHEKTIHDFCQTKIPAMKYNEEIVSFACDTTSYWLLSFIKVSYLGVLVLFYFVVYIFASKRNQANDEENNVTIDIE